MHGMYERQEANEVCFNWGGGRVVTRTWDGSSVVGRA